MAGVLFTDLERSTSHLRALGEAYAPTLARHHALVRRAIAAHGGTEVGSEGDSIASVFGSPSAALAAALDAQRALAIEPWPGEPWRVRMAVHAGAVDIGPAGAVGAALHEAARLRSTAARRAGRRVRPCSAAPGAGAANRG